MKTRLTGLLVVALVLAVPTASAHADFVSSEPPPGARLVAAPSAVRVTLSQDVDPAGSTLEVLDASGVRMDNDDLHVEEGNNPILEVSLKPGTGEGAYLVKWKALSRVDHHTTQRSFGFAVGNFTPPSGTDGSTGAPGAASVIGRALFFVGVFLAVASIFFVVLIARSPLDGFLREVDLFAWPLVVAGSLILFGDAVSRTGLSPGEWMASAVLLDLALRVVFATATAFAAILLRPGTAMRPLVTAVGAFLVALYSAKSGHASSSGSAWLVVDTVHLLATSAWIGGLLLFAVILLAHRRIQVDDDSLRVIGKRFSTTALVAVIVMATSGVLLGIAILGLPDMARPYAWFQGLYGTALLSKIVLAVVMVVLASVNRFVFLGRLLGGAPVEAVRPRFGRFAMGEAGVGVLVLLLAAVLTSTSPPYSAADARVELTEQSGTFAVTMRISSPPTAGGFSTLEFQIVWLEDGSILQNDTCGRPEGCILLEVVAPGAEEHDENETDVHQGGEHRILEPRGDGWWTVPDVLFVSEGGYTFLVEIQTEYVFFDVVELHLMVGEEGHDGDHAGHTMEAAGTT